MSQDCPARRPSSPPPAQGIGRATAEAFAREGARVIATDLNVELLATLKAVGRRPAPSVQRLDVLDAGGHRRRRAAAGPVTCCSTARASCTPAPCSTAPRRNGSFAFDLNVRSQYRTIKAFLPGMLAAGNGSIINMASVAGSVKGAPNRFVYGATKAAVIGLTKAWRPTSSPRACAATPSARARWSRRRCATASRRRPRRAARRSSRSRPRSSRASRWAASAASRRSPRWRCTWPATNRRSPPAPRSHRRRLVQLNACIPLHSLQPKNTP
jgi:NAD(P)-dependent dehydrogenase (short-subunit alcohol dehydrogenase family)